MQSPEAARAIDKIEQIAVKSSTGVRLQPTPVPADLLYAALADLDVRVTALERAGEAERTVVVPKISGSFINYVRGVIREGGDPAEKATQAIVARVIQILSEAEQRAASEELGAVKQKHPAWEAEATAKKAAIQAVRKRIEEMLK